MNLMQPVYKYREELGTGGGVQTKHFICTIESDSLSVHGHARTKKQSKQNAAMGFIEELKKTPLKKKVNGIRRNGGGMEEEWRWNKGGMEVEWRRNGGGIKVEWRWNGGGMEVE